jgi:hypothetical protein
VRAYRRVVLHRRVVVNLTTGKAIEGVLWDEQGPLLVLRDAFLHEGGTNGPVPMDGEVVIDRARVEFVQAAST